MIYLNNAATTWPKPEVVYQSVDRAQRAVGTPGRNNAGGPDALRAAREAISRLLGIPDPERLIFLPGCTYALNLAILGHAWRAGERILMSGLEHHAVSRPVRKLAREHGVEFEIIPRGGNQPLDLDFLDNRLKSGGVRLVCCTMASNVTGEVLPVHEVVRSAHAHDALCLVDAAQAAGVVPLNVGELGADLLAFAGHKGLFGPPGVGCLWVRPGLQLNTLAEGGTGKDSGKHELSGSYPSTYEIGTHNMPAIIGLGAGALWLLETGPDQVRTHEARLVSRLLTGLQELNGVRVYGPTDAELRTSAVSMTFAGREPAQVAAHLSESAGVVCRAGFHCAPLAHETIGTLAGGGTLRLSPGYFNTEEDIDAALAALRKL